MLAARRVKRNLPRCHQLDSETNWRIDESSDEDRSSSRTHTQNWSAGAILDLRSNSWALSGPTRRKRQQVCHEIGFQGPRTALPWNARQTRIHHNDPGTRTNMTIRRRQPRRDSGQNHQRCQPRFEHFRIDVSSPACLKIRQSRHARMPAEAILPRNAEKASMLHRLNLQAT